jgi:hypothetical protein
MLEGERFEADAGAFKGGGLHEYRVMQLAVSRELTA